MNPLDYAEQIAYSSRTTIDFTFLQARKYSDSPGCYVECGVAAGAQIIAMLHGAPGKIVWAFDSFEGIPLPSNRDDQYPGIRTFGKEYQKKLPNPGEQALESSGATVVSIESFIEHVKNSGVDSSKLLIVKGWFEKTIPENEVGMIDILRLDGDLYHSTYICLKHLFNKVNGGGIVIIDDWGLTGCRDACIDYFAEVGYVPHYEFISDICYFYK